MTIWRWRSRIQVKNGRLCKVCFIVRVDHRRGMAAKWRYIKPSEGTGTSFMTLELSTSRTAELQPEQQHGGFD